MLTKPCFEHSCGIMLKAYCIVKVGISANDAVYNPEHSLISNTHMCYYLNLP